MNCPHCAATTTKKRAKKTKLGYATFFCFHCRCTFNERTGTPFNYLEVPSDIVLLVVLWRLRYKLSLRDLAEMFLERGVVFTHETVRDWERRFAPLMTEQLRIKRRGQAGRCWYVDAHLHQDPRKVVLPLSGYRSRWQFGGFHVEREEEYGGSPAIFQAGSCCGW